MRMVWPSMKGRPDVLEQAKPDFDGVKKLSFPTEVLWDQSTSRPNGIQLTTPCGTFLSNVGVDQFACSCFFGLHPAS